MWGTVIGDIIGSTYEIENNRTVYFETFRKDAMFTDDTVRLYAHYEMLNEYMKNPQISDMELTKLLKIKCLSYLNRGWGGMFYQWLVNGNYEPYGSYGNGAIMSASAFFKNGINCNWDLKKINTVAKRMIGLTHNHERAQIVLEDYLTLMWELYHIKKQIGSVNKLFVLAPYIDKYKVEFIEEYRNKEQFDVTCEKSFAIAIAALSESKDFIETFHNVVSVGGDSDTYAAIVGPLAEILFLEKNEINQYIEKIKPYFKEFDQPVWKSIADNYLINEVELKK